jgi:hypothetical protein
MAYLVDKKTSDQQSPSQLGEELKHLKINLLVGGIVGPFLQYSAAVL